MESWNAPRQLLQPSHPRHGLTHGRAAPAHPSATGQREIPLGENACNNNNNNNNNNSNNTNNSNKNPNQQHTIRKPSGNTSCALQPALLSGIPHTHLAPPALHKGPPAAPGLERRRMGLGSSRSTANPGTVDLNRAPGPISTPQQPNPRQNEDSPSPAPSTGLE